MSYHHCSAVFKARYLEHYQISEEALVWLRERTAALLENVELTCVEHLAKLERTAGA